MCLISISTGKCFDFGNGYSCSLASFQHTKQGARCRKRSEVRNHEIRIGFYLGSSGKNHKTQEMVFQRLKILKFSRVSMPRNLPPLHIAPST